MSKGSKSKAMLISKRSLCLKSIYKKVTSLTIRQTLKVVFILKMNSTTPYSKVVTTCMMSSFLYFTRICLCLNYELYDSHSNKVQVSISEGDLSHSALLLAFASLKTIWENGQLVWKFPFPWAALVTLPYFFLFILLSDTKLLTVLKKHTFPLSLGTTWLYF